MDSLAAFMNTIIYIPLLSKNCAAPMRDTWLTDLLIDWMIDFLIDWLTVNRPIFLLIDWLSDSDWLTDRLFDWLFDCLINWL